MKLKTSFEKSNFIKINAYMYFFIFIISVLLIFNFFLFTYIDDTQKEVTQLNDELIKLKKSHYDFSQLEQVSVEKLSSLKEKIKKINKLQINRNMAVLKIMIELEKILSKNSFVEVMDYERNKSGGSIRIYDKSEQRLSLILAGMKKSNVFLDVSLIKQISRNKGDKKGIVYEISYTIQ